MATATASRLLPKIVHPATQMKREDHGKITVETRKLTSATPGPRSARGGRPHSCPEMSVENLLHTSARLTSSRLRHTRTCSARQQRGQGAVMGGGGGGGHRLPQFSTTEELILLLKEKLQGGSYFALRHGFTSFDPQGRGTVSREALYRLLSNFLSNTLTPAQFSDLLKRLGLDDKKIITFEEFFSKFHTATENRSHWLDPVIRHVPKKLSAGQVHNLLKERAKQNILNLSEFLPSPRGIATLIGRAEFKNMLSRLSCHLPDEQFDMLWNRYSDKGDVIEVSTLLAKLGVQINSTEGSSKGKKESRPSHSGKEGADNDGESPSHKIAPIINKLNENRSKLMTMFAELDKYKCGKLTAEQIRIVLNEMSISITQDQMTEVLVRLGFSTNLLIDYSLFVEHFSNRSNSGLVHSILSNPNLKYHITREMRACESVEDAENKIVTLLQDKFLHLLADFRSHDPRAKGYILKSDFISILYRQLGLTSHSGVDIPSLADSLSVGKWVPYPKFLAMFEGGEQPGRQGSAAGDSRDDPMASLQPEKLKQLVSGVQDVALHHTAALSHEFTCIDVCNTGRLTLTMLTELMQRFGVVCDGPEGKALWSSLVKNKDGTVDFKEFIRVFASRPNTANAHCSKKLTDDHYFMRSKTLHRDEDMILESLRSRLVYYHSTLLSHFKSCDPHNSGYVTSNTFTAMLLQLCPDLTDSQLARLVCMFQDTSSGFIAYKAFLSQFTSQPAVYRRGNNLGQLLAHRPSIYSDTLINPQPPEMVNGSPTYGLPGVKANLQKQLASQWRIFRRLLSRLDSTHNGHVTVVDLRSVLLQCGVSLTSEQWYHLMETFDPHLSGTISYKHFIEAILE